MRKIHIALAADSNYLVPITVVLQSIFDNNRGEDITIYLLYLEGTLKGRPAFSDRLYPAKKRNFHRVKNKTGTN
ncbi:hypothetical protein [Bacteroides thetaiotaomicron]|uniref:hypothetical protein n=1 Tax=Bacteroides thetaiotaomicron TaxID=818 RepID=UPI0039C22BBA